MAGAPVGSAFYIHEQRMKLIARTKIIVKPFGAVGPFRASSMRAGQEFECDDDQGARLIRNGLAVEKLKGTRRAAATAKAPDA